MSPDIEVFNLHEDYVWKERGPGDYIGRGSPLGNPWVVGRDGARSTVIEKFRAFLWDIIQKQGEDLTDREACLWAELCTRTCRMPTVVCLLLQTLTVMAMLQTFEWMIRKENKCPLP
jgi:hypothetical protein